MDAPSLYALLICGILIVKFFLIGCIVRYRKEQKKEYELQLRRKTLKPDAEDMVDVPSNAIDPEIGDQRGTEEWEQVERQAGSISVAGSSEGEGVDASRQQQRLQEHDAQVHERGGTNYNEDEDVDDEQGAGLNVEEYLDQFETNGTSMNADQQEPGSSDEGGQQVQQTPNQQDDEREVEVPRTFADWNSAEADDQVQVDIEHTETNQLPEETPTVSTADAATHGIRMPSEHRVADVHHRQEAPDEDEEDTITVAL